jgi:very-short-patch-repair endonuclease
MLVKCPLGHKYDVSFNVFRSGHGCPHCYEERKGDTLKLPYDFVKKEIEKEGYELLSTEYQNSHTPLEIKCPKGHVTNTMTYGNFKQGARCSKCNNSKGERRIINYLENNNIKYIYEKTFKGLLGLRNGLLSYDFYLPKYNLLIEYQGEQHEHQCEMFGNFEKQQEHDKRKREYAKNNNIGLLEIWYWDFDNIEKILEDILK